MAGIEEGRSTSPCCLAIAENDARPLLKTTNSFKIENLETLPSPKDSGKMVLGHSLSFKNWEPQENKLTINVTFKIQSFTGDEFCLFSSRYNEENPISSPMPSNYSPLLITPRTISDRDAAAVKLQKVYKSYRTRRSLADCAVIAEELWWKALDFASLEQSSVSFFDVKKPETAVSKWARAGARAAKVGKGLLKDTKAQKLALQHWLEAIDPRHRYGHNLHLYYDVWFNSESSQPFFYWLDVGEGKVVNHEKCPRQTLQSQCIKYLVPKEREAYEVTVKNGKLVYRQKQLLLNTVDGSKWIFVLSTSRKLYVGQKKKGTFQHSSFLSGGAASAAGRLVVKDGFLKAIWPYSGHYRPTEENFDEFLNFLKKSNIDLTDVKRCSVDDDEYPSFSDSSDQKSSSVEETASCTDVHRRDEPAGRTTRTESSVIKSSSEHPFTFDCSQQLSRDWTSGTGPRIRCVRDYPTELQFKALEQVNLSPRLIPSPTNNKVPIPSPRPDPEMRLSPRMASLGIPTPRISLTLPANKKRSKTHQHREAYTELACFTNFCS